MGDYYCSGSLDEHVVLGIFVASLRAVGCATTLASAGLWLARQGMMTPALSKGLSQLSVKLAIPCLLFSSVVPGVSPHVLSYGWPLLLLPAVHLLLGMLVGCLTVLIVKPPDNFRLGTVAACAFGNTTGIPIVLLSVLQQSLGRAVFAELADPLLFLSLQLLTYPLLQWILGLALMWYGERRKRGSDEAMLRPTEADAEGLLHYSGTAPLAQARRSVAEASTSYIPMMAGAEDEGSLQLAKLISAPSVGDRLYALVQQSASRDGALRLCRLAAAKAWVLVQRLLVPPVLGVSLGALVGMLGRGLVLPPEVAPLGWLYMGISKLGAAAVPINLILLGAALSRGPARGELPRLNSLGVVLARLVLMPLCGLAVARLLVAHVSVPPAVADPFWLVTLIVTCTPTANNIVVLCELAGDNKHACSTTIFYQYTAAPLLLPFVLTLFVVFICRTRELSLGDEVLLW
eukprot:Transcript_5756.p2 GENE.Transcript_5756~~Transcript_5756.p2  ORF type:complete len:460 (+),score=215.54 Transcript_5756:74-1453(+)